MQINIFKRHRIIAALVLLFLKGHLRLQMVLGFHGISHFRVPDFICLMMLSKGSLVLCSQSPCLYTEQQCGACPGWLLQGQRAADALWPWVCSARLLWEQWQWPSGPCAVTRAWLPAPGSVRGACNQCWGQECRSASLAGWNWMSPLKWV